MRFDMNVPSMIGLIGDVHQEDQRLASLLAFFAERRVTKVLCVGDLADGVGDFSRTITLLKDAAVDCALGNHDRWLLRGTMRDLPGALPTSSLRGEDRSYLSALPKTRMYETTRGRLLLCHGMGDDDMGSLRPDDDGYALESNFELQELIVPGRFALVVAGHTHQTMVRRLNDTWFINPGTLRGDHGATSAVLDLAAGEVTMLTVDQSEVSTQTRVSIA
jgi:putative phosphoesterase